MKIAVYSICKNEESQVERFASCVKEADQTFVIDTGSTDKTISLFENYPWIELERHSVEPWRFDLARNMALSKVPSDFDLVVALDLDEAFSPGWRRLVESSYQPDIQNYTNMFENMTTKHRYIHSKIHRRHGAKWINPIHEQLEFTPPARTQFIDKLWTYHHQDLSKPRDFYIEMLEQFVPQSGKFKRDYYPLLVREYFFANRFQDCLDAFEDLCGDIGLAAISPQSQANCRRYSLLSKLQLNSPIDQGEIEQYWQAVPSRDNMYVAALFFKKLGQFELAYTLICEAEKSTQKDYTLGFVYEEAWSTKFGLIKMELASRLDCARTTQ